VVDQTHLPEKLLARKYYSPTERGFEKELVERLKAINTLKKKQK
jgi:putative ATPase